MDLTWCPSEKSSWTESFIRNTLTIALGFVPVAGTFLQIIFAVGWDMVREDDPQVAYDMLKNLCPGIDLTDKVIREIANSVEDTKKYIAPAVQQLELSTRTKPIEDQEFPPKPIENDKGLQLLMQKEVLDATGNSPDLIQKLKTDVEDTGEIILENIANATFELVDGPKPSNAVDVTLFEDELVD